MIGLPTNRLAAALLATLLGACGSGSGEPTVGSSDAMLVNLTTVHDQQRPVVASNGNGRGVVVWESFGQDGSHLGIFARRIVDGAAAGPEFQVNTYTASRQSFPAVGMDADGDFVIAWRSSLQGSPGGTIFAQRFAADGTRLGEEFRVGPDDSARDSQSEPQMAMGADGSFVIAWSNREVGALAEALGQNQLEDRWIEARVYNADGSARTAPTRVTAQATDRFPRAPRVAMDAQGNIVLVWATAAAGTVLRAQHFGPDLLPLSEPYDINELSAEVDADLASVAMAPSGAFAIAWEAFTFGNRPLGIFVRRYDGPQRPVGPAQVIAPPSSGLVERNAIDLAPSGDLLLVAQSDDRVRFAVQRADGSVFGPLLVSDAAFPSLFGSVARSGDGRALIAWQSFGADGDGRGVHARELSWR
ncbi:hypothetical protein [Sinimarinibacterium thermocellulolyticum]|uniref:Uncharacterized protein n=1 Tax=Sinimarinibacterium thermocellulolyticum TaxID=3170016 RepID=A0ABV2AF75_9GAMM